MEIISSIFTSPLMYFALGSAATLVMIWLDDGL